MLCLDIGFISSELGKPVGLRVKYAAWHIFPVRATTRIRDLGSQVSLGGGLHARVGRNICASVNGLRISTMLSGQWPVAVHAGAARPGVLLALSILAAETPQLIGIKQVQIGYSIMLSQLVVVDVSEPQIARWLVTRFSSHDISGSTASAQLAISHPMAGSRCFFLGGARTKPLQLGLGKKILSKNKKVGRAKLLFYLSLKLKSTSRLAG